MLSPSLPTVHCPPSTLHSLYPYIRDLFGQVRGYRRWSIRREVARFSTLTPEEGAARSRELAWKRYLYALEHFPAYKALVQFQTNVSDLSSIPFESLPILTKSDLKRILSPVHSPLSTAHSLPSTVHRPPIPHSTGGSTGQPFKFFITRESYEWRTAVSDRGYSWARAEEGQRSFYVWGTAMHKPGGIQRIKQGLHHWLQNRKYFDSFDFNDARKAECCRQINRFKPISLVGYAGNLIELARYAQQHPGVLTWRAKTAVTAAEGLRPGMRALIEAHLAEEVHLSYGSREFMLIGMEGPDHDGYYLSADNLYVEVVDAAGKPCAPGETGRIVVTDLHNDATPFVRYAIGDLGRVGRGERGVGSPSTVHRLPSTPHFLPRLAAVEGRLQEVIVKANGEKLTALFVPHLMKEFDWVDGYQIIQDAEGKMIVHLVTQDADWQDKAREIRQKLLDRLGDEMQIRFQVVANLQKTQSGKTPIVVAGTTEDMEIHGNGKSNELIGSAVE